MSRRTLFALLAGLAFSGLTVLAHHSVAATYDTDKKITLHGAITQVDWRNPHVFYFIDVADGSGKVTNWAIEVSTPNQLYLAGWRKDDVKAGDTVTLTDTAPARNGSPKASGGTLTLPTGLGPHRLPLGLQVAGTPGDDARLLAAASWVEAQRPFPHRPAL